MSIDSYERHEAKYSLPFEVDCSVAMIIDLFLSNKLLEKVAEYTNQYIKAKKHNIKPVSVSELLNFFSIIYYMEVVRLPAKKDYWDNVGMWLTYPAVNCMSNYRFECIWLNLHLSPVKQEEETEGEVVWEKDKISVEQVNDR